MTRRERLERVIQAIAAGQPHTWTTFEAQACLAIASATCEEFVMLEPGDREFIEHAVRSLHQEASAATGSAPSPLNSEQIAILLDHRIAVFAHRFIDRAQPPITTEEISAVEDLVAGPLPIGLLDLWHTSFGGVLHYDLRVRFDGAPEPLPVDVHALYHPAGTCGDNLFEWITHERTLQRANPKHRRQDRLDWLPVGGYESDSRLYVRLTPGPDHGSVWIWRGALPPGWSDPLGHDATARVANDMHSLFAQFHVAPQSIAEQGGRPAAFRRCVVQKLLSETPTLAERVWQIYTTTRPSNPQGDAAPRAQ